MNLVRAFVVCALLAVASVVTPAADAVTTEEFDSAVALLAKINTARVNKALGTLTERAFITIESENHSAFMASRKRISHNGFQARSDRIFSSDGGIRNVCENVAYHKGYTSDPAVAAKKLFQLWKNSPPHNACMFDKRYGGSPGFTANIAGVGVKRVGTKTWYGTFIAARDTNP